MTGFQIVGSVAVSLECRVTLAPLFHGEFLSLKIVHFQNTAIGKPGKLIAQSIGKLESNEKIK